MESDVKGKAGLVRVTYSTQTGNTESEVKQCNTFLFCTMQQTLYASYMIPFSFNPSSLLKIDQPERNNYILYVESMYTRQATSFAKPGNEYNMIKEKEKKKKKIFPTNLRGQRRLPTLSTNALASQKVSQQLAH